MSKEGTPIDISTAAPELQRLAEEVNATMRPRRIQRAGETIAVVMPVASKRRPKRTPTTADREAALASFGGWDGNVDTERLKQDLAESRRIPPRRAPDL